MPRVLSSTAFMTIVGAVVLSGLNGGLRAESASADSCQAAPNGAAPAGQHWYFHVDREKGGKCWYLHALQHVAHHAAAQPGVTVVPAESTNEQPISTDAQPAPTEGHNAPWPEPTAPPSLNAPSVQPAAAETPPPIAAPAPASPAANRPAANVPAPPAPESPAASAPATPHITILNVKTVSTPFAGTPAKEASPQPAPEQADVPAMTQSASKAAVNDATAAAGASGAAPRAASDGKQNKSAQTVDRVAVPKPAEMYFLIAIALGITAFLLAAVGKATGRRNEPGISDHPDIAWANQFGRQRNAHDSYESHDQPYDERDSPSIDPQRQQERMDLRERARIGRSSPDRYSAPQSKNPALSPAAPPSPQRREIEAALRALRQARQQRAALGGR